MRNLALFIAIFAMTGMAQITNASTSDKQDGVGIGDIIKREFVVQRGGTLFLDLDHGDVDIRTTSGNKVYIEIKLEVDADSRTEAKRILERYTPEFEQHGKNVSVKSRFDREEGFWSRFKDGRHLDVEVEVKVPENYNIDFASGAGNVYVQDIVGDVVGRTGAGGITVTDITGRLDVRSGTGNIDVDGVGDRASVSTGAGNITLRDMRGELDVNTGAGNITAEITSQPERDSDINTGAGNVTVILADDISVDVRAVASIGNASTDYPLSVESSFMKKSFRGEVNGGGPRLTMHAGVGNVALRKN